MRGYVNKPIGDLATQLKAGLVRLRKGYVDAAETLLKIIDPSAEYPYEFVVYRLTGYRPPRSDTPMEPIPGKTLRYDLLRLILDVSESFDLYAGDYDEPSHDTHSLAKTYHVSTKTIQRWRRRGLPARRMIFPDGRRRIGFLESSVHWLVDTHRRQVQRSMKFTQMTDVERTDLLRRARRMAAFTNCTLTEVAKRLAVRTGRAVETVRYTIRRHDMERPDDAVFPYLSAPLGDSEKAVIYRCFLQGVAAPMLADRYRRTRGSIYRIINEMRARQLLQQPIEFIYNPQFDMAGADEVIIASQPPAPAPKRESRVEKPQEVSPYFSDLYDVPLLDPERERDLFRRYNYLKFKADKLRRQIDLNRVRTATLKDIESLLIQANVIKNQIVRSNLRLVVSIAKKHVGGGPMTLFELISDGNVSLLRAVEKFDYSRGHRFSTYASWAIMRNFARSVPRERYQLDRFVTGNDEVLDSLTGLRSYDPQKVDLPELRESVDALLAQLSPRERTILVSHFGLNEDEQTRTFDQLGQTLGISKERVRQIELRALEKLRQIMASSTRQGN
jgi:RNA polymerase sigma factor (sigma-70 family)